MTAARRLSLLAALTVVVVVLAGAAPARAETVEPDCFYGTLTLPPDATALPETSEQGIVVPLGIYRYTASMAEAALAVRVEDASGAVVAGSARVLEGPSLLVWTAEAPLTAGETYALTVTLDLGIPADRCDGAMGTMDHHYTVAVAASPPPLSAPVVEVEVAQYESLYECEDPAVSWLIPELNARVVAGDEARPWRFYTFTFFLDGASLGEEWVAAAQGAVLERSNASYDEAPRQLCVEVAIEDVLEDSRTVGERHCRELTAGPSVPGGCTRPDDDEPVPTVTESDDCACTSVVAPGTSSPGAPLRGALLALLGVGALVWRRRARA